MSRNIKAENEAHPMNDANHTQGTGTHVLNLGTQKPTQAGIIDADALQARHAVRMTRELKHQSRIIEVA